MALSDTLADRIYGGDSDGKRATKFAKMVAQGGVPRSSDFRRIEALPRRVWNEAEDLEEVRQLLTQVYKTRGGTMDFWIVQAASLRDAADWKGLFSPASVGAGKTIVSLMAPVVMEAERPVLLVPASLRDQTLRKVLPEMRKHWKLHPNLKIVGYEELGLVKNAELLERLRPDLIVADECQNLKNTKAGRTRRVKRWMDANPNTMFVALSGTITNKSLRDYWHILAWTHKADLMPMPSRWRELQDWADALDEGLLIEKTVAPGALLRFCEKGETPRQGYRRRLTETPGVVATEEGAIGTSLRIIERKVKVPGNISRLLNTMRASWETPDGDTISEATELARHAKELCCGFFYKWDPAAPLAWMKARRAWKTYVRETLTNNRRGLDTELQVWRECEARPHPVFSDWKAIKDTFKPNTVAVWESDFLVADCIAWLNEGPGIVWTPHAQFGVALSKVSGFPYFGAGEKASRGISDAKGPIIASVIAHGTGKNLQEWNRNLVVSCSSSGKTWEQMIGRTHRPGQQADEVTVEVYMHDDALRSAWTQARSGARYIEETIGRQKLNFADIIGFDF